MKTVTTWKGGEKFYSTYRSGAVEIDGHSGYGPKAMLLGGLASCSGLDLVSLLEKMRVPFGSLEIEVETQTTEEHPKVFKEIHMVFHIKTGEENRAKLKKAIDLSLQKYCGVAAMLQKNSPITYTIDIQPASDV